MSFAVFWNFLGAGLVGLFVPKLIDVKVMGHTAILGLFA
jgi:hypothetical protein